jgi:hypothetical protein
MALPLPSASRVGATFSPINNQSVISHASGDAHAGQGSRIGGSAKWIQDLRVRSLTKRPNASGLEHDQDLLDCVLLSGGGGARVLLDRMRRSALTAEHGTPTEKRLILATVGSNPTLVSKKLDIYAAKPFARIQERGSFCNVNERSNLFDRESSIRNSDVARA